MTNSDEIQYWGACAITHHHNLKSAHNRDVQPYFHHAQTEQHHTFKQGASHKRPRNDITHISFYLRNFWMRCIFDKIQGKATPYSTILMPVKYQHSGYKQSKGTGYKHYCWWKIYSYSLTILLKRWYVSMKPPRVTSQKTIKLNIHC